MRLLPRLRRLQRAPRRHLPLPGCLCAAWNRLAVVSPSRQRATPCLAHRVYAPWIADYGQNVKIRDTLNNLLLKTPQNWQTTVGALSTSSNTKAPPVFARSLRSPEFDACTIGLPFFRIESTVVEWDEIKYDVRLLRTWFPFKQHRLLGKLVSFLFAHLCSCRCVQSACRTRACPACRSVRARFELSLSLMPLHRRRLQADAFVRLSCFRPLCEGATGTASFAMVSCNHLNPCTRALPYRSQTMSRRCTSLPYRSRTMSH